MDVHRGNLLHRVDADPRGSPAVDDGTRDLLELGRRLEAVERLTARQLRDLLCHRMDASTSDAVDQRPVVARGDDERAAPPSSACLDLDRPVVTHPISFCSLLA